MYHNPISCTARESFHSTGIWVIQHPTADSLGVERHVYVTNSTDSITLPGNIKQMAKKFNDPKELIALNIYHSFLSMLYIACQVKDENLD